LTGPAHCDQMAGVDSLIEPAPSGRAKCRGCGKNIAKDALRFGEKVDNPFGDGKATLWFHPMCGAFKRPEPFLQALAGLPQAIESRAELEAEAKAGIDHHRLPRVDGVEKATSGRAACRSCRESIAKGSWRIRLVFFQDGRFDPGGFIHVRCAKAHLGTTQVLPRLRHLTELTDEDAGEIAEELASPTQAPPPTTDD
jgi:hypothetical protein